MNSYRFTLILLGFLIISLFGCNKDKENELQLPPENSFVMDFNFTTAEKSAMPLESGILSHQQVAAVAVLYWNTAATLYTSIPAAAFRKALKSSPEYNPTDKTWTWSYNLSVASDEYWAVLTGTTEADSVAWQMHISRVGDNNLKDFLWFEGKSDIHRTGGWWNLNYQWENNGSNVQDTAFLINWAYRNENDFSIRYTYIADKSFTGNTWTDNLNVGGYIEFGHGSDQKYNAWYTIYSKENDLSYQIRWNTSTHAGTISSRSDTGCWDEELKDKECDN